MARPADLAPREITLDGIVWLQVHVAAERLKVTPGRIYHLTSQRRLGTRLHQGLLYVRATDVRRYARFQRQLRHLRTKLVPL